MKKHIFALTVFLVLLCSLTSFAAASQTFTVSPESKQTVSVNLSQGDFVNGSLSVSGGTGTGVNFAVTDPNGKQLLSYNYTSYQSFSFSAQINGNYTLSFDNSFCSCVGGKNVTLEYSVNNKPTQVNLQSGSNGGFPIATAILLVAVIPAIAAVAISIRHLRGNTNNKTEL